MEDINALCDKIIEDVKRLRTIIETYETKNAKPKNPNKYPNFTVPKGYRFLGPEEIVNEENDLFINKGDLETGSYWRKLNYKINPSRANSWAKPSSPYGVGYVFVRKLKKKTNAKS